MVCIDQDTAEKDEEPFVTLAKTRRIGGKILFGRHATHLPNTSVSGVPTIRVGDIVDICEGEESPEPTAGRSEDGGTEKGRFLGIGGDSGTTIFGDIRVVGLWFMGTVWRW